MFTVTDVKVRFVRSDCKKLRAIVSLVIDECFAVHDIKLIEGDDGVFMAMPGKKAANGMFKDTVHPINTQTRRFLEDIVLTAYRKALENPVYTDEY